MRPPPTRDDHPFTAIVCHGPACGRLNGQAVVASLRDSIRRQHHAVLMSAGCLLGRLGCHTTTVANSRRNRGVLLVVQACTKQRIPRRPAIWVGPIVDDDDVTAVRRWLDTGHPRAEHLPDHLHYHPTTHERAEGN